MIELRWTTKKTGKVLQYRYRRYYKVEGPDDFHSWSEWTDAEDLDAHEHTPLDVPPPYPEGE